ncbi:MAG: histidine kinase dimerization/phosphoacceptor domain -containing protein, partial [Rhodomicrobium sp.]
MSEANLTRTNMSPDRDAWPKEAKLAITALAVATATFIELPESFDAPGKPFLLYFIASALCTVAFGQSLGLLAIGASSVLSVLFFDPVYTFWLSNQKDFIDIIVFALIGGGSLLGLARIKTAIMADVRGREQQTSRLMLSEMAHRVANNFAAAVGILRRVSTTVHDADAKVALYDALNQLHIFASVHSQLQPDREGKPCVDCIEFIGSLCAALEQTSAREANLRFEHSATSLTLPLPQAVALGLIINELVTNSAKYAFPGNRRGNIIVTLMVHEKECLVRVDDNGTGKAAKGVGRGLVLVE